MKSEIRYIVILVLVFALASCGADAYMKKGDQFYEIGRASCRERV